MSKPVRSTLAVLLHADVVGSTRLVQSGEVEAQKPLMRSHAIVLSSEAVSSLPLRRSGSPHWPRPGAWKKQNTCSVGYCKRLLALVSRKHSRPSHSRRMPGKRCLWARSWWPDCRTIAPPDEDWTCNRPAQYHPAAKKSEATLRIDSRQPWPCSTVAQLRD